MIRELQGKNAIVTGGRKGIGRKIVELMAEQGANIWVCSHEKSVEFEQDMEEIAAKYQVEIEAVYFDLSDIMEVETQIKYILKQKRTIDILVNNAAIAHGGVLAMQSMKMLHQTFEVNFFAPMHIIQMVSKAMIRQRSGNIINIASVSGCENYGGNISYGSSKAALIWASKELSKELAPFGIRVNVVSPGMTNTEMVDLRNDRQKDELLERVPLKRMAEPEEIAEAVMFLVSDKSAYINGHNLVVDGGRLNH